jgi:hypothetical protein
MSGNSMPKPPGRSNPAQDEKHPPQLRAMLLAVSNDPEAREKIVTAYYGSLEGAKSSVAVYHAIMLGAVYNAIRHDIDAAAHALPDHIQQIVAEQAEVLRQELRAQFDQAQKARAAADAKQHEFLVSQVEQVRRRAIEVRDKRDQTIQEVLLKYGATAIIFALLGIIAHAWWVGRSDTSSTAQQSSSVQQQDHRSATVNHLKPSDLSGGYSYSADPALKEAYRALDKYNRIYPRPTASSPRD